METEIFALRTTANREDQVLDFISSNVDKKCLAVYSLFRPHGLRGYIFLEARSRQDAEESFQGVPYAKELLKKPLEYSEVEPMLEQTKTQMNIKDHDIVEIISGPFKREKAKVIRIDKLKEEVVVELLEAAVSIPITVKLDSLKVIRREEGEDE
jgi:transcription termination/antitermination protein NusG